MDFTFSIATHVPFSPKIDGLCQSLPMPRLQISLKLFPVRKNTSGEFLAICSITKKTMVQPSCELGLLVRESHHIIQTEIDQLSEVLTDTNDDPRYLHRV
jgi:hypothetical protein